MGHGGDLVAGSSPAGVPVLEVVPSVLFGLLSPGVLIALVVGVLVLTAALVEVGWWALRRLRRSARVRVGLLRLRADVLPAGPRREVATLRVDLRGHLDQTDRVLDVHTVPGPGPLKELQSRLRAAAEDLDIQARPARPAAARRGHRPRGRDRGTARAETHSGHVTHRSADHGGPAHRPRHRREARARRVPSPGPARPGESPAAVPEGRGDPSARRSR